MDKNLIYLETGSTDPFFNLAFEEYVLANCTQGSYLLLWQNENTIVVGQNQNTEAEINRSFVEAHDIRVIRRSTGGGAVYHDLGNLNYSFITDAGDLEQLTMEQFTAPIVSALCALGLQAEASGRNDILVEGRKVSGTAQRVLRDRILHHGTLLFDSNPDMVQGALQVDPEKFRSKSAKSVRSRIGNIRSFLRQDMELTVFWDYLRTALAGSGYRTAALSETDLAQVEALKNSKYATWEWNYGRSPKYNVTNRRFWTGGSLEMQTFVEDGFVADIAFFGDFLSRRPLDDVVTALKGLPFRREAFAQALSAFPLQDYFGSIQVDEILDTIFYIST